MSMKTTIFIILIFMATRLLAQPTLKYFSAQQQTELKNYVTWWSKTEAKKAADSVGNLVRAEYKKALSDLAAQLRKELKDSMAALLPASSVVGRIDSLVIADRIANKGFEGLIKTLQESTKFTDEIVKIIKQWMDKMKLVNFNF